MRFCHNLVPHSLLVGQLCSLRDLKALIYLAMQTPHSVLEYSKTVRSFFHSYLQTLSPFEGSHAFSIRLVDPKPGALLRKAFPLLVARFEHILSVRNPRSLCPEHFLSP